MSDLGSNNLRQAQGTCQMGGRAEGGGICPSLSEFTAALTQGLKGPNSQPRDLPPNWKVLSLLVLQTDWKPL